MTDVKWDEALEARTAAYRAAASDNVVIGDNYKNLRIHAFPGLHAHAAQLLAEILRPNDEVLDIAAGSGAMALRLHDLGFTVTACDAIAENFKLHGNISFKTVNLDEEFSKAFNLRFDGICAVEIIEHLENPRHFFRGCRQLLKPGGYMVLSTPNVDNPVSIAHFARHGTFRMFEDRHYRKDGHITPICAWQMEKIIAEAGLEIVRLGSFGDPFNEVKGSPRLHLLALILGRLSDRRAELNGEIMTILLRRPSDDL